MSAMGWLFPSFLLCTRLIDIACWIVIVSMCLANVFLIEVMESLNVF